MKVSSKKVVYSVEIDDCECTALICGLQRFMKDLRYPQSDLVKSMIDTLDSLRKS